MKKILIIASLVTLSGCSSEGSHEVQIHKNTVEEHVTTEQKKSDNQHMSAKSNNVLPETYISKKTLAPELQSSVSKYSIRLNGEKFTTDKLLIKTNHRLFNVDINSFGIVLGSFVVISKNTPSWLEPDFNIEKIAKETYRLQVKSLDADLYAWFNRLSKDDQFSVVEIEVRYNGTSKQEAF